MIQRIIFLVLFVVLAEIGFSQTPCDPPSIELIDRTQPKILTPCKPEDRVELKWGGTLASFDIVSVDFAGEGEIKVITESTTPPVKPRFASVLLKPRAKSGTASVKVKFKYKLTNPNCPGYNQIQELTASITYTIIADEENGCGCSENNQAGNASMSLHSLHAKFYLGLLDDKKNAGFLSLDADTPSSTLTTAASLQYNFVYPGVFRYPSSGTIQQIKSPQVLARVVDSSSTDFSFSIEFYYSSDVTFNGTIYVPNVGATPFVTWVVSNPSSNINVVQVAGSNGKSSTFSYDTSSSPYKWTLSETGNLQTLVAWEAASGADVDEFLEIRNSTTLLKKTKKRYQVIGGERYLKETVEGDTPSMTTTYSLISSGNLAGWPERVDYPDGRWEVFEYDDYGRILTKYEAYGDLPAPSTGVAPTAANGKRTVYSYEKIHSADLEYRTATARNITVYLPRYDGSIWNWEMVSDRYYWTPDSATSIDVVTVNPGVDDWSSSNNLRTKTVTYVDSSDTLRDGRLALIVRPDGTGSIYNYTSSSGNITTVEKSGELNMAETAVINGTETTSVRDPLGRTLSVTVKIIASSTVGPVLSFLTYSYSGTGLQEDYTVVDLAGRATSYQYNSCCGLLESVTDPDGRVTEYEYDTLKRKVSTKYIWGSSWVKWTNILDAAGQVLVVQRIPSSGSIQTLDQYEYDILGRKTKHTNSWGGVTSYSYNMSARTTTTTYPDLGTRVETVFKDGRVKEVAGTAVANVRYEMGVQSENGIMREVKKTIRLSSSGGTDEWTLAVTDDQGRDLRMYYAKASGSSFSENIYNSKGQLIRQTDPDGVSRLFSYNSDGTVYKTAVDMNGDGLIVDNDGNGSAQDDRITYTVRDVVPAASSGKSPTTDLVRVQTYALLNNDSSSAGLISMTETSADGRRIWSTVYRDVSGGTPVTTYYETGVPSSGIRTDKVVNPDGSYSEKVYTYGRLTTAREKNSGGSQITSVTYAYDTFGRVSTQTDARNGVTSTTYYAADAVESVTAVVLGTGEPQQVTTSYYDRQGRLIGQMFPDGSSVTNFYHVTGLLKRTYGSRAYPVEYTYDAQGRMKTMKTWQSFNAGAGTAAVTTWNYNQYRGWLDSKDYPNASSGAAGTAGPNYTYTDAGRLLTRTWDRGVVTTYEYKIASGSAYTAGDLRTVTYSDGTPATTFTYDRRGRRTTAARNGITTTYSYNEANLPLSESYSGGSLDNFSIVRTYDAYLRLDTLDSKRSGTSFQLVGHSYDTAGRLDSVKHNNANTYTAKYTYEANSRLVNSVAFTNNATGEGMLTTRAWDRLNRLTAISSQSYLNSASAANPITYIYQYNLANQRTRANLADGSYWIYIFDNLGQVTSGRRYWSDGTLVAGQDFEYTFDEIGNRDTTGGRASAVSDYSANQLNQYTSRTIPSKLDVLGLANPTAGVDVWKDSDAGTAATRKGEYFHHALTVANSSYPLVRAKSLYGATQTGDVGLQFVPAATESFSYDTDGNLTADGRWTTYVWDGENRLVEMRRDATTPTAARQKLTFEYDYLSRRIRKTFFTHNGTTWVKQRDTAYLYDGWNMIAELDANNSYASLRTYVWGTDISGNRTGAGGVGGLLWTNNADAADGKPVGIQFVAYDGNGNLNALFAASDGSCTARYEYGPFGEPVRATGILAKANPIRWSTKVVDDEDGFVSFGYRYFNPVTGRWLSRDPLGELGHPTNKKLYNGKLTSEDGLYCFTRNDPISKYDYLGLKDFGAGGGVSAGALLGFVGLEVSYVKTYTLKAKVCITAQATLLLGGGAGAYAGGVVGFGYTPTDFEGPSTNLGFGGFVEAGILPVGGGASVDLGINRPDNYYDGSYSGGGGGANFGPTVGGGAAFRLSKSCTACAPICSWFPEFRLVYQATQCLLEQLGF